MEYSLCSRVWCTYRSLHSALSVLLPNQQRLWMSRACPGRRRADRVSNWSWFLLWNEYPMPILAEFYQLWVPSLVPRRPLSLAFMPSYDGPSFPPSLILGSWLWWIWPGYGTSSSGHGIHMLWILRHCHEQLPWYWVASQPHVVELCRYIFTCLVVNTFYFCYPCLFFDHR